MRWVCFMAITQIRKRDGRIAKFEKEKIANAIFKAAAAVGGEDYGLIFTVRPGRAGLVRRLLPAARAMGRLEKGNGVSVEGYEGKAREYGHF